MSGLIGASPLSTAPQFVDKVRDVVGLYLNPPDRALVLCMDEKPSTEAIEDIEDIAPAIPMRPGQLERHTHDHIRHGTTALFAALDIKAGTMIGEAHHRHRGLECRHFLATVEQATPPELEPRLVVDNSSIHWTSLVRRWLVRHPRVHLHFTPTSASWLNRVECWFSLLTARQLRRGRFRSTRALECAIRACIADAQRSREALRVDQNSR